jgi:hypothetical protein
VPKPNDELGAHYSISERKTMANVKYRKNIACLETLWDSNIENRLSVVPILELISKVDRVKYTYLTCNTQEELKYNLGILKQRDEYGILYLSFHGDRGEIALDEKSINIERLAKMMGNSFADWIVHFGTCATIDIPQRRIESFMAATKVSMVIGYKKDIY